MNAQKKTFWQVVDRTTPAPATKFFTTSRISENIHETPEGFLVCVGVPIARTGEMIYGEGETPLDVGPDGRITISRDEKEVFRPETIASYEGKPITIAHPEDFVSPENWSRLAKGVVQNVRRGEGQNSNDLIADLLITDSVAINLVKNGLREVSCGYEALYSQTGEGRGVQTNIVGNHLALVDEGRAGSAYAINDHKGKGTDMKVGDRIKAIFSKAQDDALKLVETGDAANMETPETKTGFVSYDDFMKAVKDLGGKIDSMKGGKDASTQPTQTEPAQVVAKDEDPMEARLTKLEAMVSKLMEKMSGGTGDDDGDDMVTDEDGDDDESEDAECDDEDYDDTKKTGDSASRVEILAPGMKPDQKGVKTKALIACYATRDGKAVIDQFTGGKKPNFKDENFVDNLFIAASELLKTRRNSDFSKTKTKDAFISTLGTRDGAMTPEELNKKNAEFYAKKNGTA